MQNNLSVAFIPGSSEIPVEGLLLFQEIALMNYDDQAPVPDPLKDPLVSLDLQVVKDGYHDHFMALRAIINRYDPIGLLAIGAPEDEYEPEVKTIIVQLTNEMNEAGIRAVIDQEFLRWFNAEAGAIPEEVYRRLAQDVHHWLAGLAHLSFRQWTGI